jgi:hypothetical protein
MIQSVKINGLKGLNVQLDLTGKDVPVGGNGTGKTAILEAIQFGLTGFTGLGKKPGDLLALGNGDGLEVVLGDESGNFLTRRIQKGKTVTTSLILNGEPVKDEATLPASFRIPIEAIHPAEFLALSGDKRAAWLFEAMGKSSEGVDVLAPEQVPGKWPWLKEPMSATLILEKLTEEHSAAKKELERCKANLQRLTGSENQLPTGTQREWEEKLAKIDADLAKAQKEQAKAEERARLSGSRHLLRKELEENLAKADKKIQATEELIAQLSSLANAPKREIPGAPAEIQAKIEAARTQKALKATKAKELREQARAIEAHGSCPTCGTKGNLLDGVLSDWDRNATTMEMEAEDLDEEISVLVMDLRETDQATQINKGIDQAALQLKVEKDGLASYQKSRTKIEDDLVKLNQGSGPEDSGDPAMIAAQVEGLIAQQKDARAALKKHHEATSIKKARVDAQEALQAQDAKIKEIKAAGEKVKEIRNEILGSLTDKLVLPFQQAVSVAFNAVPFFRILDGKGKPEVDFGILRGKQEISFDTLSGGERTVILVALVAAIQIAKGGKPQLVMVEMAEADPIRTEAVMESIKTIGFEQAILATCNWPRVSGEVAYFPPPKGWSLIDMEREAK